MSKILKKYNKNVSIYSKEKYIGQFDELYFAPTEIEDIYYALNIYKKQGGFPIVMLRITELEKVNICNICNSIMKVQKNNKLSGYTKKINIKFRVKNVKELDNVLQIIANINMCKVSIVIDCCIENSIYKIYNNPKVDFVRINYKYQYPEIKRISKSNIYFLARFELSNQMNVNETIKKIKNIGFNGVQFVKGHDVNQNEKLHIEIKKQLLHAQKIENKVDVFLERELDLLNQPIFKMREMDHGKCFSSVLILTIKGNEITNCPFNPKINVRSKNINYVLQNRKVVDSRQKKCYDCGFISDNNLYRKIFENDIIFW